MKRLVEQQGDVKLFEAPALPAGLVRAEPTARGAVLAVGEFSGHAHRFEAPSQVELYVDPQAARVNPADVGVRYLRVLPGGATLLHEEHAPIRVEPGLYELDFVFEYNHDDELERIRRAAD